MKPIWTGKAAQLAGKHSENGPVATACCMTCRTCVTTNLLSLATAAAGAVGYGLVRATRRVLSAKPS